MSESEAIIAALAILCATVVFIVDDIQDSWADSICLEAQIKNIELENCTDFVFSNPMSTEAEMVLE